MKKPTSMTRESQGDITCDSLGDVTWSHGTHDVRDLSGRSDRSRMRKSHQKGQNSDYNGSGLRGGLYYSDFK